MRKFPRATCLLTKQYPIISAFISAVAFSVLIEANNYLKTNYLPLSASQQSTQPNRDI